MYSFVDEKMPVREEITQAWEKWLLEIEIPLFLRKEKVEFQGVIVGMKGLKKGSGSWATFKNVKEPKDKHVLVKTTRLQGRGKGQIVMNW